MKEKLPIGTHMRCRGCSSDGFCRITIVDYDDKRELYIVECIEHCGSRIVDKFACSIAYDLSSMQNCKVINK